MTIKECIDAVDNLKPNQYTMEEKVMWLSFLDGIIIDEVLKTHEGYDGRYDTFTGYSADRLSETLIVPSPYDRLYTAFLKMKIDEENGETQRYNNSARLYNSYLAEFKKHYNKTHMPLSVTGKAPGKKIEKVTVGLSDAERESILAELKYTATEQISDALSEANMYDVVTKYAQNNVQMLKGKDGKDGKDGEDGYTPVKGIDYTDGKDGKPFTYADFTEEQLASLKGDKGDKGDIGPQGPRGLQGIQGIKGDKGERGYKGDKGDKGDTINITCEAEGESININDSADLPMKGLRVLGKTKQLKSTGKNMIPFPYFDGMRKEENGVTFVVNDDGSITVNGTATEPTIYNIISEDDTKIKYIPSGSYVFSVGLEGISAKCRVGGAIRSYAAGNTLANLTLTTVNNRSFEIDATATDAYIEYLQIVINKNFEANNLTYYPMIEQSTTTTEYEPPTNGIPTPSPELSQPMNSAGKYGSVDIEVSNGDGSDGQTFSVATPNGLPGVPVASGGNYTDEKGQQWVCDEIDYAKGVYIERVGKYSFRIDDVTIWGADSYYTKDQAPMLCEIKADRIPFTLSNGHRAGLWERGMYNAGAVPGDESNGITAFRISGIDYVTDEVLEKPHIWLTLNAEDDTLNTVSSVYNGSKMLLIRAEPIEKPLSEEQIEEFKKLVMYKPTTNISNDDGAYLRAEYIADTKSYIDNKFAELQTAMLNNI